MASKKVSELNITTSLADNDVFVVNHLGSTNKVAYSTLAGGISSTVSQNLTGNFIKAPATATAQQVLTYNGITSTWVASAAPTGGGGVTIDSTSITNGLTTYLLKLADANKVMLCNNTNPLTAAIPASVFSIGTEIILIQRGGVVTLSAGVGVTVESNGNKLKTNGTSAGVCLINTQSNVWFLGGNTAT